MNTTKVSLINKSYNTKILYVNGSDLNYESILNEEFNELELLQESCIPMIKDLKEQTSLVMSQGGMSDSWKSEFLHGRKRRTNEFDEEEKHTNNQQTNQEDTRAYAEEMKNRRIVRVVRNRNNSNDEEVPRGKLNFKLSSDKEKETESKHSQLNAASINNNFILNGKKKKLAGKKPTK